MSSFLNHFATNCRNMLFVGVNVVNGDGEMWRRFVRPAVVNVFFVVEPQVQLIAAKLHPGHARVDGRNRFHAQLFVERGGARDIANGQ